MTTFDPSVWTSDLPSVPGFYFVRGSGPMEFKVNPNGVVSFGPDEREMLWSYEASHGAARSIHPIPSAEEIAALVECEEALLEMLGIVRCDPTMDGGDRPMGLVDVRRSVPVLRSARAALARLDAARKERGA